MVDVVWWCVLRVCDMGRIPPAQPHIFTAINSTVDSHEIENRTLGSSIAVTLLLVTHSPRGTIRPATPAIKTVVVTARHKQSIDALTEQAIGEEIAKRERDQKRCGGGVEAVWGADGSML